MKKIIVIAGIASSMQIVSAQRSINNEIPHRLFEEGKGMFNGNNYVGTENTLYDYIDIAKNSDLILDAEYMLAASAYFRGEDKATLLLRNYLDMHPDTYHRNNICFYLGSIYFSQQDWNSASYWLKQSKIEYLSVSDQEDYTFRIAYTDLMMGNKTEARNKFEILASKSSKYGLPSTYYIAYIDLYSNKYDRALTLFETLKKYPQYRELSMFFIAEGLFLKNDVSGAISAGNVYLTNYPNSNITNSSEVNRILGNCYFREGDINNSILFYEKYLSTSSSPIEEDMYQLGVAYTEKKEYAKSIKPLQLATSTHNQLGQASYMLLGQNYLKLHDNQNALMAFEAASREKFDPSISEAALYNYALLIHQTSFSLFDESVNVLQRFLSMYPKSRYTDEINKQLASTLLSTNNYRAALDIIDNMHSSNTQILKAKQSILFQLGAESYINNNYPTAIFYFDACIGMPNYDIASKIQAYYWRGEIFYRDKNYKNAITNYKDFLSNANISTDNYGNALYNLGYSYFKLKDYNNALTYFKSYATQERNRNNLLYADALNRIGDCYLFDRNFDGASQYYTQSAAIGNSQSAEYADFQKAFILGLQRNHSSKIAALDNMMMKYPSSIYYPDAMFEKAKSMVMLGQESAAIPILTKLMNEKPNAGIAPQAGILLGQSYYNTNNTNGAINIYKTVAKNYKNTDEARIAVQSLEGIYRDINDINSYVKFANSLGGNMLVTASRQDSLTYLAAENIAMKGNVTETIRVMNSYLQNYPKGQFIGDAYFQLSLIDYNKKNYDAALVGFYKTIDSSSARNLNKALIYAADIENSKGNTQKANTLYRKLDINATNSEEKNIAQAGILRSANTMNNTQEVIRIANQLISNDKTSPEIRNEAYLYRAKAYLKTADTTKAIADLSKIASDTRNIYGAEAQYLLAQIYFDQKKYKQAENQVQSFIKMGTPHPYWMARALLVLADSYVAQNDQFSAKQYLESLKANYTGTEKDIFSMIDAKLKAIK